MPRPPYPGDMGDEPEMPMPAESPMSLAGPEPIEAPMTAEPGGDTADQGYKCEGKFPLTDPMWTNDVKQGQPTGV